MKISVVVPVRDEEELIADLLDNLLAQSRRPDEIVITDGGSVDSTRKIITDYIDSGAPIKLIKSGPALPGRGRNLAAAAATSEWLGFIDAGIRPAHDWLEQLSAKVGGDANVDVIYGSWAPITDSFFKECAAIAYVPPATMRAGSLMRPRSIVSTLMRKSVWESVGGFPEHLRSGEDLLFMNRVESAGYHTVFAPRAMVHWHIKPSFTSTFSRFVAYSRNNIRAGLWREWQSAILSRYFMLIVLALPAIVLGIRWLLLPLLLWIAMLLARGVVAIRRNRFCYPASLLRNVRRLLLLIPLIAVLDLAAIIGTIEWLLKDSFRDEQKAVVVEAGNGA